MSSPSGHRGFWDDSGPDPAGGDIFVICIWCYSMLRNNVSGPEIGLPAGLWPEYHRESTAIGLPAGLRPAGRLISVLSQ